MAVPSSVQAPRVGSGPVASLFLVKLETMRGDKSDGAEAPPVTPENYSCAFRVAARDAEAAVTSARVCMRDRLHESKDARVVSVEIIDGIDAM
jgi:hypothetical protein